MSSNDEEGAPLFQGPGLLDEHDGDVVPDFVQQTAMVADEAVLRVVQTNAALAFRACQNLQQFLADSI